MKLIVGYHCFAHNRKKKGRFENIPFIQAALVSGQNKYTHSPLTDTAALYSERHEISFHAEVQAL